MYVNLFLCFIVILIPSLQYNDIRQECGFKNVIITNRMSTESNEAETCPFIEPSEAKTFQKHKYPTYYWWVVLHELLGHGTGKMMIQESENHFNFDINNPPVNPLTGKSISTWYKPGQTWTGQFGDLATTVDECRAELVGAYLMDDKELLGLFGFNDKSEVSAEDSKLLFYTVLAAI
jgi:dipeptidyl-peptidase III